MAICEYIKPFFKFILKKKEFPMKKLLSFLSLVFLFFPVVLLAGDADDPIGQIIALSESDNAGCSVEVFDSGDYITIRINGINSPKGTKLEIYSGMRDAKTPVKIVHVDDGCVEFKILNYPKIKKTLSYSPPPTMEYLQIKLMDGSELEFDQNNEWVYFGDNPDGSINYNDSKIGMVMFSNFPTAPLNVIEGEEGVLKLDEHPELK